MAVIKRDGTLDYSDPEFDPADPTNFKLPSTTPSAPAQVTPRDNTGVVDPPTTPPAIQPATPATSVFTNGPFGADGKPLPKQPTDTVQGQPTNNYNSPALDQTIQPLLDTYINDNQLQADQSNPRALQSIVTYLRSKGYDAQLDTADANGHLGGILLNGHPYQMIDGNNGWTPLRPWQQGAPDTGGGGSTDTSGGLNAILQQILAQGTASAADTAAQRSALSGRVNSLLDQYSKPVNASDPTISGMVDAYHGTNARALADYKEQAAERAHAEGVPSGAFDAQIGNATMAAGRSEGTLQAQLMSQELQSRRAALSDMLTQSGGLLSASDKMSIQQEMDSIDGLIKGQELGLQGTQIKNQNAQFYDNLTANMGENTNLSDQLIATLLAGRPPA